MQSILEDTPLSGHSNIRDCEAAAQTLQEALRQELNPGISILQAVSEQKELFTKLSATFGRRLHEHLSTQFVENVSYNECLVADPQDKDTLVYAHTTYTCTHASPHGCWRTCRCVTQVVPLSPVTASSTQSFSLTLP